MISITEITEGEQAISLPVGGCVTGDGLVDAFAYF
jgi:hypothetical protein